MGSKRPVKLSRDVPAAVGKGREGKGDVLPLPQLIITWQVGGAAGGVATRIATSLLSWCL